MDHSYPYIASLTREPFLFYEMRSTAKLMVEGISNDAIVKEIVEQNLFQYPTEKSITRMAKACKMCIRDRHYKVALSHSTKKLVRLIFAMEKSGRAYLTTT